MTAWTTPLPAPVLAKILAAQSDPPSLIFALETQQDVHKGSVERKGLLPYRTPNPLPPRGKKGKRKA
jgi:hypothetical protein